MNELKTQKTDQDVTEFLAGVADEVKRKDCQIVCDLMQDVTGEPPALWGSSIVGFGQYKYRYASGRSGVWPLVGFSPRKQNLTLYIMDGYSDYQGLLAKIGPHKIGKACLYLKSLEGIDRSVLRTMIERSVKSMRERYPSGS